jgi:hypothetical protein
MAVDVFTERAVAVLFDEAIEVAARAVLVAAAD